MFSYKMKIIFFFDNYSDPFDMSLSLKHKTALLRCNYRPYSSAIQKCTVQWVFSSLYMKLCITIIRFQNIFINPERTLYPLAVTPIFLFLQSQPQSQVTSNLLSSSIDLPVLNISYDRIIIQDLACLSIHELMIIWLVSTFNCCEQCCCEFLLWASFMCGPIFLILAEYSEFTMLGQFLW